MKIAVLDDYADVFRKLDCAVRLEGHDVAVYHDIENDPKRLAERLRDAEVVIMTQARTDFPGALIERLPNLKFVSLTGANASHVDLTACAGKGVAVAARKGNEPSAPAELAWGLILASLRHIPEEVQRLKSGQWQASVGTGVAGKTLGIYAYGRIGSIVAQVGKAFGMHVVCWGREGSTGRAREAGFDVAPSKEAFFESADVLSLHLPVNKDTRGVVTRQDLARMKPTALLVNVSRAALVEPGALEAALKAGRPGFAAVDVYEQEPVLGANHPLIGMDNALCTPHLGYCTRFNYESYYGTAVDNFLAFAAGKPVNILDPEVLKPR